MFPEKKWKQSSGKSGSLTIIIISVLLFIINRKFSDQYVFTSKLSDSTQNPDLASRINVVEQFKAQWAERDPWQLDKKLAQTT